MSSKSFQPQERFEESEAFHNQPFLTLRDFFVRKKGVISAQGAWENESYEKYYFGPMDVKGNSTQHDNLLYFGAFYKILCHL